MQFWTESNRVIVVRHRSDDADLFDRIKNGLMTRFGVFESDITIIPARGMLRPKLIGVCASHEIARQAYRWIDEWVEP